MLHFVTQHEKQVGADCILILSSAIIKNVLNECSAEIKDVLRETKERSQSFEISVLHSWASIIYLYKYCSFSIYVAKTSPMAIPVTLFTLQKAQELKSARHSKHRLRVVHLTHD